MAIKFVNEADLTTVGNAIRAKTGGSDLLTFPEGMAEAIAAIQAGGGGSNYKGGSFILPSYASNYTVQHGLGKIPDYALCFVGYPQEYTRNSEVLLFTAFYESKKGKRQCCLYGKTSSSSDAGYQISSQSIVERSQDSPYASIFDATVNSITFGDPTNTKMMYLAASSNPYYWLVW